MHRSKFANGLAKALDRPYILVDFGNIIIWLDKSGHYNHATMWEAGGDWNICISRFSNLLSCSQSERFSEKPLDYIIPCVQLAFPKHAYHAAFEFVLYWASCKEMGRPVEKRMNDWNKDFSLTRIDSDAKTK